MKFNLFLYRTLLVVFVVMTKMVAFAQPSTGPPPNGGGTTGTTPPCWDPECVPVDGGVIFLLAAGALLGVKMMLNQRNKIKA